MNYVFYKNFFKKGGVPDDIRDMVNFRFEGESLSPLTKLKELKNVSKGSTVFVIGFSDITSLAASMICAFKGIRIYLMPLNQVNLFLDYYNPFNNRQSPIFSELKKSQGQSSNASGHVSKTSRLKRKIWRKTGGRVLINLAERIVVLSRYELDNIKAIYPRLSLKVTFGTFNVEARSLNWSDRQELLPTDKFNLLIWSRVDPFFKGIDRAIEYMVSLKSQGITSDVHLNIMGPDFESGYSRIQNLVETHSDCIEVQFDNPVGPGDKSVLRAANAVVLLSRWDGLPRTLREAYALGVPIITSPECNFDAFEDDETVFIVKSFDEFKAALQTIKARNFDPDTVISLRKSNIVTDKCNRFRLSNLKNV